MPIGALWTGVKTAVSVGKKVAEVVPVAKQVLSKSQPDPEPRNRSENIAFMVASTYRDFQRKHDTDGDGKADWTPQEVLEMLATILTRVSVYV